MARTVLDGIEETLRQKHQAVAILTRLHHVDRVREKLVQLAREYGRVGKTGVRIEFPLTHELLGEMTGSARETVTRALRDLESVGFLVRRGRTYTLKLSAEELAGGAMDIVHKPFHE